jgi:hypothetical protein
MEAGAMSDFDAWEPQEPPSDFAERVVTASRTEAKPRGLGRRVAGGALVLAAAAAAVLVLGRRAPSAGEIRAEARQEAPLGGRAIAVLEPGAHVAWRGDDVTQDRGDVFYRVEPAERFVVHTPAGDVTVHGTCFRVKVRGEDPMNKRDVKSGALGAALSAMAFVAVYEGKVAVSHAGERVELAAGEAAQATSSGVTRAESIAAGERGFDAKAADDEPLTRANANLADAVREYKERLEAIERQKKSLETQLHDAQDKLAAAQSDGAAHAARSPFDLTQDDWKDLAKDGTVKYQLPWCGPRGDKPLSPDSLDKLGLSPQDGATVAQAMGRSYGRLWSVVRPLCAQAIGGNVEMAEKIGLNTCIHLVRDITQASDPDTANEAFRQVSEIRAGLRPMPGPGDAVSPLERIFLATTGEMQSYQADLAQAFGPDEAHRIAFADAACKSTHSSSGPGPRKP